MPPASAIQFDGRPMPSPPDPRNLGRAVISSSQGRAKANRQKPEAAGPASVSRTRIGAKPSTRAARISTMRAAGREGMAGV